MKVVYLFILGLLANLPTWASNTNLLEAVKSCEGYQSRNKEINELLLKETAYSYQEKINSTQVQSLSVYFSNLTEQSWESLKKNCPKTSFNLFILNLVKVANSKKLSVEIGRAHV